LNSKSELILLDSGNREKLELVGPHRLVRPCPQAVWAPRLPKSEWDQADACYIRNDKGGGHWEYRRELPKKWSIEHAGTQWLIKPTSFGHLGIFPEQEANWQWLGETVSQPGFKGSPMLNLFAYTGGSTMAMARAGAHVTHVDASKGTVAWARENAQNNHVTTPTRWLVDDAVKFTQRELRRQNTYRGIVMDPPTFGRGPTGQYWKIEFDLLDLLTDCRRLLAEQGPALLLLSCHSPGFSPLVMENLIRSIFPEGELETGEMHIPEQGNQRVLPAGVYARWLRK
jgi:23S rRNA (cytosine1962-C5)-methyltransferase